MKELKILYIEDDKENREGLIELLNTEEINGMPVKTDGVADFDIDMSRISQYHIVILDLFKGVAGNHGAESGKAVLERIRERIFVPVIFYSGNTESVKPLRSQIIGVATKGDGGYDELKFEIARLSAHNLPFLKEKVHNHIEQEFQKYFWDVIQEQNDKFKPDDEDYSLGYMLLRNFGNSLSKNNICKILGDGLVKEAQVHPMEFYIYPTCTNQEYENGEIIKCKDENSIYIILTPSCDMIERYKNGVPVGRKAKKILLAKALLLTDKEEAREYLGNKNKENRNKLLKLIQSSNDRYFFLPGTPFIEHRVVDFQDKIMVDYESLKTDFTRIAKLDSPFAQAMSTSFIRYYNRIGFPDIDVEYILTHI